MASSMVMSIAVIGYLLKVFGYVSVRMYIHSTNMYIHTYVILRTLAIIGEFTVWESSSPDQLHWEAPADMCHSRINP